MLVRTSKVLPTFHPRGGGGVLNRVNTREFLIGLITAHLALGTLGRN